MSYIGAEPDGMGKAQRFTFTASGGETVVSADDDGIPIGYTAGQVSVYLNGVKLVVGTGKDCQATNGSTITGLAALAASDVVEVVALSIFSATTVEGTDIISTGVTGTSKYLRVDGDGTSSWQTAGSTDASDLASGILLDARMPNLTGDVTTVEGAVATTIADNAVTLAKMAGGTDGNLITYDTSGDPAYVATGTSGHVLTSAGADAVPTFQAIPAGGITHASQWRTNTNFTTNSTPITAGWEECVNTEPASGGVIGSSMVQASGIFTFPVIGVWYISLKCRINGTGLGASRSYNRIYTTTNNSTYNDAAVAETYVQPGTYNTAFCDMIFDITSVSTHKVRFDAFVGGHTWVSSTDTNYSNVTFIRLGDA